MDHFIHLAKQRGYTIDQALALLLWCKHDLDFAVYALSLYIPCNDEWPQEDKLIFEYAFELYGKNFRKIKEMVM